MCVFCQIIAGEIPSYKIYEDERSLVILDIQPVNHGHLLVLPKNHCANIEEASESDLSTLILLIKRMGGILKNKLGVAGYNVTENNDPVAGQNVPHLHFHIIPRHAGDTHAQWPQGAYLPGEADEMVKKLTS